jgi:2-methylcitrate dehydratase PrpD
MSAVVSTSPAAAPAKSGPTIAETLAGFAIGFDIASVPAPVIQYAKLCIADAIGIGLASTSYEFAEHSAAGLVQLAGRGDHPIVGMPHRLPVRDAALLNGLLIHGLDYDDTHPASIIHCSASAVPLILAAAPHHNATGAQALSAYLIAVEADARIGQVADGQFQKVGFHPTGSVGIFGATLAAGYLAGLDPDQLAHAQGIALSMAAGSLEFLEDGAWTKRMHPGWAASSAITAAAMAGSGFIAPLKSYEGRFGLFNIYLQDRAIKDLATCTEKLGEDWEMMRIAIKPYPVCHFNHAFIDAALALRVAHSLTPADIDTITVRIHENQSQVVCEPQAAKRRPQSDYDAKFSVHYAVATALAKGRFTLDELDDDALADQDTLALCDRVNWETDPDSAFPRYYSGELVINTTDGRTLRHREAVNRGADARPLSEADVRDKFLSNARRAFSADRAERLWAAVMQLDSAADISAITAALGTE